MTAGLPCFPRLMSHGPAHVIGAASVLGVDLDDTPIVVFDDAAGFAHLCEDCDAVAGTVHCTEATGADIAARLHTGTLCVQRQCADAHYDPAPDSGLVTVAAPPWSDLVWDLDILIEAAAHTAAVDAASSDVDAAVGWLWVREGLAQSLSSLEHSPDGETPPRLDRHAAAVRANLDAAMLKLAGRFADVTASVCERLCETYRIDDPELGGDPYQPIVVAIDRWERCVSSDAYAETSDIEDLVFAAVLDAAIAVNGAANSCVAVVPACFPAVFAAAAAADASFDTPASELVVTVDLAAPATPADHAWLRATSGTALQLIADRDGSWDAAEAFAVAAAIHSPAGV